MYADELQTLRNGTTEIPIVQYWYSVAGSSFRIENSPRTLRTNTVPIWIESNFKRTGLDTVDCYCLAG